MKKLLMVFGILVIGSCVFADIFGIVNDEPPEEFMAAFKTCTNGTYKTQKDGQIRSYTIKGKTQTGRCIVEYTHYVDYSNKKTYDSLVRYGKSFSIGGVYIEPEIPTQEEMIKLGLSEKTITTCKFNSKERDSIYAAYQKHDSTKKPDGSDLFFDFSDRSSYDHLMEGYLRGPCESRYVVPTDAQRNRDAIYACEYSDTTCYMHKNSSGSTTERSLICIPGREGKLPWDIVEKHVKSGMCEKI